jgi:soluble lytic murein transglycosylase-like protein
MDLVRTLLTWRIAATMLAASPAFSSADGIAYCGTKQWQSHIAAAAARLDLPERWLHAVMHAESAGCDTMNGSPTTSSAGAMGLMQLMPRTWATYREKLQLGHDPYDPHDNILAASAYLRDLDDRYGWPNALAAYHAGPTRYDEHLSTGRPLPRATLDYLARVEQLIDPDAPVDPDDRTLFVAREHVTSPTDERGDDMRTDDLFVDLRHGNRKRKISEQAPANVQP